MAVALESLLNSKFSKAPPLPIFVTLTSNFQSLELGRLAFICAEVITVITNDGRNIVGNLRGFDQATNLILDECHERIFSPIEGVQQEVLGLYVIRGDNM
jgi:small nuclear ribonucleoprotein (snRNP)-like protein